MATIKQLLDALTADAQGTATALHTPASDIKEAGRIALEAAALLPTAKADPDHVYMMKVCNRAMSILLAVNERQAKLAPTVRSIYGHKALAGTEDAQALLLNLMVDLLESAAVCEVDILDELAAIVCRKGSRGYVAKPTKTGIRGPAAHALRALWSAAANLGVDISHDQMGEAWQSAVESREDVITTRNEKKQQRIDARAKAKALAA